MRCQAASDRQSLRVLDAFKCSNVVAVAVSVAVAVVLRLLWVLRVFLEQLTLKLTQVAFRADASSDRLDNEKNKSQASKLSAHS